jgi:hypothetical protein
MTFISNKKYQEDELIFWVLKRYKNSITYGITICYWIDEPRQLTTIRLKQARQELKEYIKDVSRINNNLSKP